MYAWLLQLEIDFPLLKRFDIFGILVDMIFHLWKASTISQSQRPSTVVWIGSFLTTSLMLEHAIHLLLQWIPTLLDEFGSKENFSKPPWAPNLLQNQWKTAFPSHARGRQAVRLRHDLDAFYDDNNNIILNTEQESRSRMSKSWKAPLESGDEMNELFL